MLYCFLAVFLVFAIAQIYRMVLLFKHRKLPTIIPDKVDAKVIWTLTDAEREKRLYLQNTNAFWLNPNRYGVNGEYDLLAKPYRETENDRRARRLGTWTYEKPTPPKTEIHYW